MGVLFFAVSAAFAGGYFVRSVIGRRPHPIEWLYQANALSRRLNALAVDRSRIEGWSP
jgi:uncharacterized membrane protein YeiH